MTTPKNAATRALADAVSAKIVQAFVEEDQELVTLECAIASAIETALVEAVAQEREECAAECDTISKSARRFIKFEGDLMDVRAAESRNCAAAIRARGTP